MLGNDVPELLGTEVPELFCEIFVVEDGLGSDDAVDEDGERLVDELPGSGKGRSGASSWLEYHQ